MLKAIAFGIAAGAGIQALRAWPASEPVAPGAVAVVVIVAVVCAFLAGRARRPAASASASAYAEATATATAQQQVNVALVVPRESGGAAGKYAEFDTMPWLNGAPARPDVDEIAAAADGIDLAELLDHRDAEALGDDR